MLMTEARAETLVQSVESEIRATMTPEQIVALRDAAHRHPWNHHPVNIRFSLPLLFGRYYFRLVAGPERRSARRLASDRSADRRSRLGGMLLFIAAGMLVGLTGLIIFMVSNGLIVL